MATAPYNGFEVGLATEGNPLKYPEGATRDELNFDLLQDGTRRKRLGLEIEKNGGLFFKGQAEPTTVVSSHLWNTQTDGVELIVVQLDSSLYVWPASNDPISKEEPTFLFDVSSAATRNVGETPSLDFASGNGYMIVVGENIRPIYFEYKGIVNGVASIQAGLIDIRIRDFVGVDDGLAIETRPGRLTPLHRYNLENQGWTINNTAKSTDADGNVLFAVAEVIGSKQD